jgi:hypothetical protein
VTKDAVRAYAVAFMPRYALLRRTLALPDERQHLSDPHWLERLLQHGIFENDVPGRFTHGYGAQPAEIGPSLRSTACRCWLWQRPKESRVGFRQRLLTCSQRIRVSGTLRSASLCRRRPIRAFLAWQVICSLLGSAQKRP